MSRDMSSSGSRPGVEMALVPCRHCSRTFTPNRIEFHEKACIHSPNRRKVEPYDSIMHRWKGTDNEPALPWLKGSNVSSPPVPSSLTSEINDSTSSGGIRHPAGEMQQDGRVKCPECSKLFRPADATRHIPLCAVKAAGRAKLKEMSRIDEEQ